MSLGPEPTPQSSTFPIALAAAQHIHDLAIVVYPEGIQRPSIEPNVNIGSGKFRYDRTFLLQFMKLCTGKPSMLISPGALGLDPKVLVPRSTSSKKSGGHDQGSDSTSEQASKSPTCPSVFAMAGYIHDLETVMYPEGVQRPSIELNVNMRGGQFRYDRDFLLQFMNVCTIKPVMLTPIDALGLEPGQASMSPPVNRGGSGRHRQGSSPPAARQATTGLGFGPTIGLGEAGSTNPFSPGNLAVPPGLSKLSSEERFNMSNRSVFFGDLSLEPAGVQEMANPSVPKPGNRTRSKRGEKKAGKLVGSQPIALLTELVAPLQVTANRWDRTAIRNIDTGIRTVRSLLNKLAPDNFDSISDQIISWINKPGQECGPIPLQQATRLIFEHSITGELMAPVFAELCRRMMGRISPSVQDDSVRDSEGKPIAGGQLFRKYLLGRCQEDFEQWWSIEPSSATVADDQGKGKGSGHRIAFDFDAYDAAQKAKQQSLGLIKFVGELFKLKMLTERIMHEHVKRLLEKCDGYKGEKAVEGLRKLLVTIGALLDVPKARARMDVYFQRLKDLAGNQNINSRMHFMLQDLIELRERKWVTRRRIMVPMTIAQLHEMVAQERAVQEEASRVLLTGLPRGWKRGENKNGPSLPVAGGNSGAPKQPPKAEPVAPLQVAANRWDRTAVQNIDMGVRTVRSLLNKLAPDNFDSISDQIISWINKPEHGRDPTSLRQATRLIFEHSITGELIAPVFASLCKKMMERISPSVPEDDGIQNSKGKPVAGGQLFRKYLLGRCQEDWEQGWAAESAAATAATEGIEVAEVVQHDKGKSGSSHRIVFDLDAHDAAQKAKQQGLGLIKFVGELFKFKILAGRIMHEYVKELLRGIDDHKREKEVEGLRKLLIVTGALLDVPKAQAHMNAYFRQLEELVGNQNISSRMHFMLQDLIELRERKWVTRRLIMVPMTIAQLHEMAAQERAVQEEASHLLLASMPRRGWKRGENKNSTPSPVAPGGDSGAPMQPPKAGDPSNFGEIKPSPTTSGPTNTFKKTKREPPPQINSSSNTKEHKEGTKAVKSVRNKLPQAYYYL